MRPVALVAGEAIVDVTRTSGGAERDHPGGSAANAAVALARLGREVWYAGAWAADPFGDLLAGHLAGNGVRLAADPVVLERTGSAVATIGDGGAATYDFDISWRLPEVDLPADVEPVVIACGSIGAVLEPGAGGVRDLVARWHDRVLAYYDVNARPQVTGVGADVVAHVERLAAVCGLVKASDEDLVALWPGSSEEEVVARLLARGAAAVVVTRGGEGVTWVSATARVHVPAPAVDVVDTIGAGDTLGAAVVDALWQRGAVGPGAAERLSGMAAHEVREVLDWAARAAAVTVSRPGADPPHRHELT